MKRTRRQFTEAFRRQVVAETSLPGASVAGTALAHRINANIVHKWRRRILGNAKATDGKGLIPIAVIPDRTISTASPGNTGETGAIEIHLAGARLTLRGRVDLDALQTVLMVLRPR